MGRIASTIIEKVAERGGIISPPNTPTPKIYNQHKKNFTLSIPCCCWD